MATPEQYDKASSEMHQAAMALYMKHLVRPEGADEHIQAAMLTGMVAAVAQLMWLGRRPDVPKPLTPKELAAHIKRAALSMLQQYEKDDRANRAASH